MRWWRYILLPFSLLYGTILWLRRKLFNNGILKRKNGAIPSIIVGNLQVGGAGKTPMVLWLAEKLSVHFKVAVLSRGYKRKTKGFLEVSENRTAEECGDEPLEMHSALPAGVRNFVCENRLNGIAEIAKTDPEISLAILDDAYQHLALKGNFYALLTEYSKLFTSDLPMPSGRLREFSAAAADANCIVVTKCPPDMETAEGLELYGRLMRFGKPLFFASYENAQSINSKGKILTEGTKIVLVSGLANNNGFADWASKNFEKAKSFTYRDHKVYGIDDLKSWKESMDETAAKAILTTRKDYMRMKDLPNFDLPVYYTNTRPAFLFDGDEPFLELIKKSIRT